MSKKTFSFWEKDLWYNDIDIAIIGAGIVGISTAIFIKRKYPKRKIAILEAASKPYGASTKNAGFACFGSVGEILDDANNMSQAELSELIRLRWEGLNLLRSLVKDDQMDYVDCGGFELYRSDQKDLFENQESKLDSLNKLIEESIGLKNTFCVRDNQYGINAFPKMFFNKFEGSIHPVKMINKLICLAHDEGVIFHWNTGLKNYHEENDQLVLQTNLNEPFLTRKLIITTNAFTNSLLDLDDIIPARNQVIMSSPIQGLKLNSCFHFDRGYVYFRNYGNRVLLGGARNLELELETTDELGENRRILDYLLRFMTDVICPDVNFKVDYKWSGIIAVGKSKKPIVKQISDKVFIGVRMGGMGVAIGTKVGENLSLLVE